jgi:hypothetical protein
MKGGPGWTFPHPTRTCVPTRELPNLLLFTFRRIGVFRRPDAPRVLVVRSRFHLAHPFHGGMRGGRLGVLFSSKLVFRLLIRCHVAADSGSFASKLDHIFGATAPLGS